MPHPKGSLAKGSWHGEAVTEGFTAGTFQKHGPMWKPATLGIPPVLPEAKPPPFGKGGFDLHIHLHRSNDTGHWRGSNDSQKIPVRIVSGDSPPKLSAGTARRLPCERELAKISDF